jgi:lipoprotein signal peptidase
MLALGVLALDQGSKAWAARALRSGATRWIWRPWLGLGLYWNAGAANDVGAHHPGIVLAVGLAGTAALAAVLIVQQRASPGVPLMLGGAAGNVLSRLVAGAVPDFIRVYPGNGLFNLADLSLQVGVIWVAIDLLTARPGRGDTPT